MTNKPEMSRLTQFYPLLTEITCVLEHGEKKYGNNEAYLTYPMEKDVDAALRHIFQWKSIDDETKKSHIAHAICRLFFTYRKLNGQ